MTWAFLFRLCTKTIETGQKTPVLIRPVCTESGRDIGNYWGSPERLTVVST